MTAPTLLIMAAGLGSRYGGPKQLEPIGPFGETLIEYSVFDAVRAGFGRVLIVVRRELEMAVRVTVGARIAPRVPVDYLHQELDGLPPGFVPPRGRAKPWGTGHAVLAASEAIAGPFATINADDFYGRTSFQLIADHLRAGTRDHAMVGFELRRTLSECGAVTRGICRLNHEGYLEDLAEVSGLAPDGDGVGASDGSGVVRRLTGDEIVSMNMWGFTPCVFPLLREQFAEFLGAHGGDDGSEFLLPRVVRALIGAGRTRCVVLRSRDRWLGLTHRGDRTTAVERLRQLIAAGVYPGRLWD